MKSERRTVLRSDLFVAAIMLGTGLFSGGPAAVLANPVVTAIIAVLVGVAFYLTEHDVVPGLFPEVTGLVAFVVVVTVGVALVVVLSRPVAVVSAAALTGGGVGVLAYRTLFGVLGPVPAYRLEKERDDDPETVVDSERE